MDGKEYLTHNQLRKDIQDELYVNQGALHPAIVCSVACHPLAVCFFSDPVVVVVAAIASVCGEKGVCIYAARGKQ
jgi:hypothetical protein